MLAGYSGHEPDSAAPFIIVFFIFNRYIHCGGAFKLLYYSFEDCGSKKMHDLHSNECHIHASK